LSEVPIEARHDHHGGNRGEATDRKIFDPSVERAEPDADGRRVRLTLGNLREGCIHELRAAGVRSAAGVPLVHDTGWYTLNRLPK